MGRGRDNGSRSHIGSLCRRAEEGRQGGQPQQVRGYGPIQTGPLPELSWRARHMDRIIHCLLRSMLQSLAVDHRKPGLPWNRLCDVQRSPQT